MKDLVKVQCILETGYNDKELGEFIEKNKIYYVTEERAKLLEEKKVVKRIDKKNYDIDLDDMDIDEIDKLETIKKMEELEDKKTEKLKRRTRRKM